MRKIVFLGLVGLCTFGQGCSLVENGARTLVAEPAHYPTNVENTLACTRNHNLAAEIWNNYRATNPQCAQSADFACGFKQGFEDYLYSGGTGQPPPLPPRDYWRIQYQTPEGLHAIEDWYAGFAAGTEAAKATGIRERTVVPVTGAPYAATLPAVLPPHTAIPVLPGNGALASHVLSIPSENDEGEGAQPELQMPSPLRRTGKPSPVPAHKPAPAAVPENVQPLGGEPEIQGPPESIEEGEATEIPEPSSSQRRGPVVPLRPDDGPVPGVLIEEDDGPVPGLMEEDNVPSPGAGPVHGLMEEDKVPSSGAGPIHGLMEEAKVPSRGAGPVHGLMEEDKVPSSTVGEARPPQRSETGFIIDEGYTVKPAPSGP